MKNLTDEQLKDISLRNFYQKVLGKVLRAYQWRNLKLEIKGAYPDDELNKDILEIVAKYKKVSPNWITDKVGIDIVNAKIKEIPLRGLDGASLFMLAKSICRYKVSDRTVKQWFYDVSSKCDLSKDYPRNQCIDICVKAMTSKPRGLKK